MCGKYYQQAVSGSNLIAIEPELARVFPDSESVHRALRLPVKTAKASAVRRHNTQCYTCNYAMRVFKNKPFARFADRNDVSDEDLCEAVARASRGLIDADLGGGVIKQRIARKGAGRSGGLRSMIL